MHELVSALSYLVIAAELAPLVVGLPGFSRRTRAERATLHWLLFGAALNIGFVYLSSRGLHTARLAYLSFPLFGFLALRAMTLSITNPITRRVLWLGFLAYLIPWALANRIEPVYNSTSGPLLWLLLTIAAVTVILSRFLGGTNTPLRDFGFLIGLGMLVSYAPQAGLEPLTAQRFVQDPELTLGFWVARQLLLIAGAALFTLGFLWTRPTQRPGG